TFAIPISVNAQPVAGNDSATVAEDNAVTIAVLANDTDADGQTLTITGTTPPAHGSIVVNPNQTITYTPNGNFNGSDSFTYSIADGFGGTATGTVTVTVLSVNDAPSFTKGPNQSTLSNAGPQSVPNWATNISAGPPDEAGQALNFVVSNNNPSLFSS